MARRSGAGVRAVATPDFGLDPAFAMTWVTGSAGFTDADPNSTPPAAARRIAVINNPGVTTISGVAGAVIRILAKDGTSFTFVPWFFDYTQNLWIQYAPALAVTLTTTRFQTVNVGGFLGAEFFIQITVNTAVTTFGFNIA